MKGNNCRVNGLFIVGLIFLLLSGVVQAEEVSKSLNVQIGEMLNLGIEPEIQEAAYAGDRVILWKETMATGLVKNWGLILYNHGQPGDSWFYTGPLTNTFLEFHLSFHQFTDDGRKELCVVGTNGSNDGWAYFFVFDISDAGIRLLYESESNSCGASYFVTSEEIYSQGMFLDLDLDQIEELFIYHEVHGSLPQGPCWVDIFTWEDGEFVQVNERYPVFYIPFFEEFQKAAAEEEKLPMGNHRIYYEYMAKIYQIWEEDLGVQEALQKALLPPMEMGKKIEQLLAIKGYTVYQSIRADLDSVSPEDAIVWVKGSEENQQEIWVISQKNDHAADPVILPLPINFLTTPVEISFVTAPLIIQLNRNLNGTKPDLSYCYRYTGDSVFLEGREEVSFTVNGQIIHRIMGQMYKEFNLVDQEELMFNLPLIEAHQITETIRVDGIFSENIWSRVQPVTFRRDNNIISGVTAWNDEEDLSFSLQAAYQAEALYLTLKIKDDIRIYSQNSERILLQNQDTQNDHVEIWLMESGQLRHYSIFILPMQTMVVEWSDATAIEPTRQIKAQWMPASDGYWMELEIKGLDLSEETCSITIIVSDIDDDLQQIDQATMLGTSQFRAEIRETLGRILLN